MNKNLLLNNDMTFIDYLVKKIQFRYGDRIKFIGGKLQNITIKDTMCDKFIKQKEEEIERYRQYLNLSDEEINEIAHQINNFNRDNTHKMDTEKINEYNGYINNIINEGVNSNLLNIVLSESIISTYPYTKKSSYNYIISVDEYRQTVGDHYIRILKSLNDNIREAVSDMVEINKMIDEANVIITKYRDIEIQNIIKDIRKIKIEKKHDLKNMSIQNLKCVDDFKDLVSRGDIDIQTIKDETIKSIIEKIYIGFGDVYFNPRINIIFNKKDIFYLE